MAEANKNQPLFDNLPFLILLILKLFTRNVCEIFVYKDIETIEQLKSSLFFKKKIQTLRVNNSRILRIKNANFSAYYLY